MVSPTSFEQYPEIFREKGNIDNGDLKVLGLIDSNKRTYRYIKSEYFKENKYIHKYKVLVPKANGSGAIGEVLSTPSLVPPSLVIQIHFYLLDLLMICTVQIVH